MINFQMKYLEITICAESTYLVRWNKTFIFDENTAKLSVKSNNKFSSLREILILLINLEVALFFLSFDEIKCWIKYFMIRSKWKEHQTLPLFPKFCISTVKGFH